MANQKAPSAEFKVVKAQIQEQKVSESYLCPYIKDTWKTNICSMGYMYYWMCFVPRLLLLKGTPEGRANNEDDSKPARTEQYPLVILL